MIRITENIIFNPAKNAFDYDDLQVNFSRKKMLYNIVGLLAIFGVFPIEFLLFPEPKNYLSFILQTFLIAMLWSFLICVILRLTKGIDNFHVGDLMINPNSFDYQDKVEEKKDEDKFIYLHLAKSDLEILGAGRPTFPADKVSYFKLYNSVQLKKDLIIRYSIWDNLKITALMIVFIIPGFFTSQFSSATIFISMMVWCIVLRSFGYSAIKSYRFWTKLEQHLEKYGKPDELKYSTTLKLDYEKIHEEVVGKEE